MESGRYIPPQARWENNSALASFSAARDPDYRMGGGFGSRGFPEGNYPGESVFPRNQYRRDVREGFAAPPPVMGLLPPARRGVVEDEYAMNHGDPRHEKVGYVDAVSRDVDRFRDSNNFRDVGPFRGADDYREFNKYQSDSYQEADGYRDYGHHRRRGFSDRYEADNYDQDHRSRAPVDDNREGNQDLDYDHTRHAEHSSEYVWRKHERRPRDRDSSWENYRERPRDRSLDRGRRRDHSRSVSRSRSHSQSRSHSHSRSCSYDDWRERSLSPRRSHSRGSRSPRRSRSPRQSRSSRRSHSPLRSWSPRSYSESRRDSSGDDGYHESSWRRGRDDRRYYDRSRVAPSATLVVKGLSQKTVEDDLYRALVEWGPLRHVRIIKERGSGASRGFAFIDFPSVDAARKTMEGLREDGLTLDGRRVYFEYRLDVQGSFCMTCHTMCETQYGHNVFVLGG